jgi:hypothetical protein
MRFLIALVLCMAPVAGAQVTLSASVVGNVWSSRTGLVDRESFGLRYRTPAVGPFTVQVGVLATRDNGIHHPTDAMGLTHTAVAVETALSASLRVFAAYAKFDEIRNIEAAPVSPSGYYRSAFAGAEWHTAQQVVRVERRVWNWKVKRIAVHEWVVRSHGTWWDGMVSQMVNPDGASFPTVEATVHYGMLGLTGGTRAMLATDADRSLPVRFLAMGLFLSHTF